MAHGVRDRPDAWWYHRVVGHAHAAARLRAGGQARTAFGWMVQRPDASWLRAVNRAQLQPGLGGLAPAEAVAAVAAEHGRRALPAMALDVRALADAAALGPALHAAGWAVQELAVLAARPAALLAAAVPRTGARSTTVTAGPAQDAVGVRRTANRREMPRAPAAERELVARQWVLVPAPDVLHLLARDADGHATGAAVLHLGATHVEVDDLLVLPEARRAGAGTALLHAAAAVAADRGAGRLGLLAERGSLAHGWYARLGLTDLGTTTTATREG